MEAARRHDTIRKCLNGLLAYFVSSGRGATCRSWVTQGVPNERCSLRSPHEYLHLVSVFAVTSVVQSLPLPRAWPNASGLSCPIVLSEGADFCAKCPRTVRGA